MVTGMKRRCSGRREAEEAGEGREKNEDEREKEEKGSAEETRREGMHMFIRLSI